jgi:hypothetical protein
MTDALHPLIGACDGDGIADDTVLPAQFWSPASHPRGEPEKRLLVAVLEDALSLLLNDARCPSKHRRGAVREAARWLNSDDRSGAFSFASICDLLGLDVVMVRRAIHRLRAGRNDYGRKRIQAGIGRHRVTMPRNRRPAAA